MFAAGSVLREQAGPVPGVALDCRAAWPLYPADTAEWHDRCHGCRSRADESGPAVSAGHHQRVDAAPAMGDVAVTEIQAQQVGVGLVQRRSSDSAGNGLRAAAAASADRACARAASGGWLRPRRRRSARSPGLILRGWRATGRGQLSCAGTCGQHAGSRRQSACVCLLPVPRAGFEPACPFRQMLLRHPCLPFHHPGFISYYANLVPFRFEAAAVRRQLCCRFAPVSGLSGHGAGH